MDVQVEVIIKTSSLSACVWVHRCGWVGGGGSRICTMVLIYELCFCENVSAKMFL